MSGPRSETGDKASMSDLIETHRGTVYPWQCDHMNHMNVMWYVGKFDEATWNFFSHLGLTPSFLRSQQRGMAAVEQRIAYLRELHAGDSLLVRSGALEVKDKTLRFVQEMRNVETGELAAVTVLVAVHIDTLQRKSCALPAQVAQAARASLVDYQLPW